MSKKNRNKKPNVPGPSKVLVNVLTGVATVIFAVLLVMLVDHLHKPAEGGSFQSPPIAWFESLFVSFIGSRWVIAHILEIAANIRYGTDHKFGLRDVMVLLVGLGGSAAIFIVFSVAARNLGFLP